ncbi:protein sidekick-2-like [Stylophora pistillata]|nr:protein sidekick-2-like [Stylophora pistillata]
MQPINNQATRTQEVTRLDKNTEYKFQILAFSSVGDGPNSTVIFKKKKEAAPSGTPSQFIVTVDSSTSITFSWQLPLEDSRHGIITGYKLFFKEKDSGLATSLTIENGNTSTRVDKLDEFTEYGFQVLAFTSAGNGPNTSTVFAKSMEDAPSAPISLSSADVPSSNFQGPRLALTWSKPANPNGIIRGYTLFYSHGGGAPKIISKIDKDTLNYTVDVLAGVIYQFHVRAVSIKPGPNGTITVATKEYAPSAPMSLSSVDVPPSNLHGPRITLTWSKPANPNGFIKGYTLFYSHGGGAPKIIPGIEKDALNYTVDVQGGVIYQFHVRAVTIVPGPNRTKTVMSKEYEPIRGPEGISSSAVNSKKINITWVGLPREVAYGFIVNYEVRISLLENCSHSQSTYPSTINTTSTYILVTGLYLCAKYEVSVRGDTAAGPGPYSIPVIVQTIGNPIIEDLPKRTITVIGELAVLTCEVSGDSEASVTWTKEGLTSIPRAQFKKNGKILIIQDVALGDSGVYECKTLNIFGVSRRATTLIVAVPPSIVKEFSPSLVICEKKTPCFLSCQATRNFPFNYTWTKDGQVPTSHNIKLMNNSIIVTPRDAQNYGEYVCHVTNGYGSTEYKITLFVPSDNQDGDGTQSILLVSVIALSCIVVVLIITNGVFIWQRRRAVPNRRVLSKEEVDFDGVRPSPDQQLADQQVSETTLYMELKPRSLNEQSQDPTEYQSLQKEPSNPGYHNIVFQKGNAGRHNEEIYEEISQS